MQSYSIQLFGTLTRITSYWTRKLLVKKTKENIQGNGSSFMQAKRNKFILGKRNHFATGRGNILLKETEPVEPKKMEIPVDLS